MNNWQVVEEHISAATGKAFRVKRQSSVGGGCINSAYRLSDGEREFFIKTNAATKLEMFRAEFAGLQAIAESRTLRVPRPVVCASGDGYSFLVLEYLCFGDASSPSVQRELGRQLAAMHSVFGERFGWYRDNTIGSTPQINTWTSNWVVFWCEHRLGYQLDLALNNGYGGRLIDQGRALQDSMAAFFTGYRPRPSLLHGDLWSGNYAADDSGCPLIFDPAVYYGDRETDLAMTELFGGFSSDFYHAYREASPLDAGYALRRVLYKLYHVLNHLNLFGGGYQAQSQRLMDELLSHVR